MGDTDRHVDVVSAQHDRKRPVGVETMADIFDQIEPPESDRQWMTRTVTAADGTEFRIAVDPNDEGVYLDGTESFGA